MSNGDKHIEIENRNLKEDFTMKLRRVMAGTLAATLVLGSSMMVFAADPQTGSATGTGESIGHVDKEVLTVTLPTENDALNQIFDYKIDPERVIDLAGKLKDGTTSVTANAEGVYFKNSDNTYSSSSDEVRFEGKNSVAVDVSVAAEVTATDGGKDIALVADNDALTAATTPALLMNLTVGTDTKAITSEGATAKAKLDGVPDNFEVTVESNAYKYSAKAGATGWKTTTVKLSGKTNKMDVPADMTAPKIKLTWTVAKHVDSYLSATTMTASSNSVTLSLPDSVTLSKAEITYADGTGSITLTDQYTLNGTTLTVPAENITAWLGLNPAYSKMVLTFSDGKSETITFQ